MKKILLTGLLTGWSVLLIAGGQDTLKLTPKSIYGREARVIAYILETGHYRKLPFNDSLSSAILDHYIKELDNNKSYFLWSDINSFEKYRYLLDDKTKAEDVSVAYEIYNVMSQRYAERMKYLYDHLLNQDFDYTADEDFESDREKLPWAKTQEDLNEIWRKTIKNQALSLKLAGKSHMETVETIKKRYDRFSKTFSQFNAEDVFSIYMNCITEAYDPHTNYFSPKSSDLFKQSMSLSLEGIGAQLTTENDYTKVAAILPGGDAERSGKIHVSDFIIGVAQGKEGEMVDVIGWRLDDVVRLIKGPKGTYVRLNILAAETGVKGIPLEITLLRDKIKLEGQAAKKKVINYSSNGKDLKVGVITLPVFYMDFEEYQKGNPEYRSTTRDVKKLIHELKSENIDGLVMDLRNNGGGALMEAIDLTGLFIKDGPVVQVKLPNGKIEKGYDEDQNQLYSGPLVVLTNRFSASASEIFAGAIQDYQRGVIVGEDTYGKGTVQRVQGLKNLMNEKNDAVGELKITFQKFYRVSGSSTQHRGVVPDIKLPSAFDASHYGESSNLSALPWDEIPAAHYQKTQDVDDKILTSLKKNYESRLRSDITLKKYLSDTEELRHNLQETKVSLNEVKRKKELDEAEKKKGQAKLDTKVISKEGKQDDLIKLNDEYMREGIMILAEITLKRVG